MATQEHIDALTAPETPTEAQERRRPGRMEQVSEELVPLLRGTASFDLAEEADGKPPGDLELQLDDADQLRAAKGVMLGALLGFAFWLSCIGVLAFWMRG